MATAGEKQLAVRYMLLGMVTMLVIVGAVWGVAHLANRGDDPPAASPATPAVSSTEPVVPPVVEADPEPLKAADADLQAKADASTAAMEKKAADAPKSEEELTAEEREAQREEKRQKEIAFMEESFDNTKEKLLGIIDTYFEKPMEERPEYIGQAMREFGEAMRAEREAAGLTGRPRGGPRMMGEFLRVANEKLSDDEKAKVKTFMGDVMQMQMARFQSEMDSRLKTDAPKVPAPADPDEIRLR